MDYLNGIINGLLIESANVINVTDAIRQRKEAEIYYEADDDPSGNGKRIIQPVAYGLSKAGNMVVRAFQPYGDTKTRVPHWKLFRLDKIQSWKTLWKRTFSEPPGQFTADGKFNEKGDNTMSKVYLVANFERSRQFSRGERGQGLNRYNKLRQQAALEKDPLYKLKQNIAKSQTDDAIKKRAEKYKSPEAMSYARGNDEYIKDMGRVNNDSSLIPQTSGAIEKGNTKYQDEFSSDDNVNVENNGPVMKK